MSAPSDVQTLTPPSKTRHSEIPPIPPVPPGDGGGGDGAGGWESGPPIPAAKLAMIIFLGSVTMLFIGLLGAYLVLRGGLNPWPPPGMPARPDGLWGSTGLILASSFALVMAGRRLKSGASGFLGLLVTSGLLGIAFLVVQVILWQSQFDSGLFLRNNVYAGVFYLLTGVHFLHVFAGVVYWAVIAFKAKAGAFRPKDQFTR